MHTPPSENSGASAPKIRVVARLFQFVSAPFRLLRRHSPVDEVIVYSAPPGLLLWFVITVGFLLRATTPGLLNPGASAWIFICALLYFLVAILYDLNLKKLILCTLVVSTFWLGARHFEYLHHVAILGWIARHLAALNPQYDSGTVSVLCWLLLVPWTVSLLEMVLNRRKKFSPNEIAESHFGEGAELTDRSGLRFVTKYRDVLETLLSFGGGDLLAVDNHHNVIKRYENVLGLWFRWAKLDRILHQRATLVDDEDPKPAEPDRDEKSSAPSA